MSELKFTEEEIREIVKDYELNEEELLRAFQRIAACESMGIEPSKQKIAVVVGGQPGAGKTNCITHSKNALGHNCVIIDNDAFRNYHPQVHEIKRYYPALFTDCTDQLSFKATPWLIDFMSDQGYNLIIHQTLKNNVIADNAISMLRDKGYVVIVRALAVSDIESKMSMIERSQALIEELGYCRWVPKQNHDVAYEGLPRTVDYIQSTGKFDMIEILRRGGNPAEPEVLYRTINPQAEDWRKAVLAESNFETRPYSANGAHSAREAVEIGRRKDRSKAIDGLLPRIAIAEDRASTPEESIFINEVRDLLAAAVKSKSEPND